MTARAWALMMLWVLLAGCVSGPLPAGSSASEIKHDGTVSSEAQSRRKPVVASLGRGMIVADDRIAAEWGAQVLRKGGNAMDAAVATAFVMAVTRPHYASLGGGGFLLFCPAPKAGHKAPPCSALDFREIAPAAATRDMFVKDGKVRTDLSQDGALASGVPGNVAGLLLALERHGKLPRHRILSEAIRLARTGIRVTGNTERSALERWKAMNPEARRLFGCGHPDRPCEAGTVLRQPELAAVLETISKKGAPGFYEGKVARQLVEGIRSGGGLLSLKDLAEYRPTPRSPIARPLGASLGGGELVVMGPPSSGGILLSQLFDYVEHATRDGQLSPADFGSPRSIHVLTHALSLAFADRAKYLGDPAFTRLPMAELLSPDYLDARWLSFTPSRAALPSGAGEVREPHHTTHLSTIDSQGNAVAMTLTVNDYFGSGFVPPGTGIVMNNEMDDFSAQPGVPNLFGLVGAEANSIAPGKKPLSSMTPTIVRDEQGRTRIAIGGAGGPRIVTAVFLSLMNRLYFNQSLPDAVCAPRFHHQWKPDALRLERFGFAPETRLRLRELGYRLEELTALGTVHALERFPAAEAASARTWGVADPRGEGDAVAE